MKDITEFVAKCPNCQQVKVEHQKLGRILHKIQVHTWKWEDINMDFVVGLPWTQNSSNSIWVIVDRLNKYANFIPVKFTYSAEDYAKIITDEIMSPWYSIIIILDRRSQFTSRFWRSFQEGLGSKVKLSTAFHPQTDGQAECTI